jgi:hypothetical protein
MTDLRYPIGKFKYDGPPTPEQRQELLHQIEQTPANLRAAVQGLSQTQLDTPYRPEGWTVRQVAHHVPDSHLNAYIRTKLALTEDDPTLQPEDWKRTFRHPDLGPMSLEKNLVLYAWHGRHHVAHVTALRERNGW